MACSLSQLRKHEMEHLTYDLEVIYCEARKYYLFGSKGDISEGHKNLQDIFTKLVLSLCYPRWNETGYDLEKYYHLEKQKSRPMPLAMENCAKKVQVTPRTKNCIPSLSNLTGIVNVLKVGSRIPF